MASKAGSRSARKPTGSDAAATRAKRSEVRGLLDELETAASLARATADRLASEATGNGLARAEVLRLLSVAPLSVPSVARRMRQTRQSTQRLVDVLEVDGCVQRLRNPDHRVSPLFTVTPVGLRLLARQDDSLRGLQRHLARGMTAAEVARLTALLATVTGLVDDYLEAE